MTIHKYSMKTFIFISMLLVVCSFSQANDPAVEILGKWRPVAKDDATFVWDFQSDGTLVIKGDNGRIVAGKWKIVLPDLLELTQFPSVLAPEHFRIENDRLILIDSVKKTERVSTRLKE